MLHTFGLQVDHSYIHASAVLQSEADLGIAIGAGAEIAMEAHGSGFVGVALLGIMGSPTTPLYTTPSPRLISLTEP